VHGIANVDYGTALFVKKRKQDDNGMLSCAGMYKMKAFFFFFSFFLFDNSRGSGDYKRKWLD
jgi:hypothetical protein